MHDEGVWGGTVGRIQNLPCRASITLIYEKQKKDINGVPKANFGGLVLFPQNIFCSATIHNARGPKRKHVI